jgi:phospholipase C
MLGALSGIKPNTYSNLDKEGNKIFNWGAEGDPTNIPAVDPKETFDNMAQQILDLDLVIPDTNPYHDHPDPHHPMGGFVRNYQHQSSKKGFSKQDVMHMFDISSVPVTTWLAQNFAVCDQWFGSVPTQTFPNRMFAQCANSGQDVLGNSYIDDFQYGIEFEGDGIDLVSVFGNLDAQLGYQSGVANWKLYFHDYTINGRLLNYVNSKFDLTDNINVCNFNREDYPPRALKPKHGPPIVNPLTNPGNTFAEDVAGGTLAPYTFIEPRYSDNFSNLTTQIASGLSPNSNHPGSAAYDLATIPSTGNTIDVINGERLLLDIYKTLRYSDYWDKTLLIITYDEHGGCFDHVTPPKSVKPGIAKTGGGFEFDYYGPGYQR